MSGSHRIVETQEAPKRIGLLGFGTSDEGLLDAELRLHGYEVELMEGLNTVPRGLELLVVGLAEVSKKLPELFESITALRPRPIVVAIADAGDVTSAVTALRAGAHQVVERSLEPRLLAERLLAALDTDTIRHELHSEVSPGEPVLNSPSTRRVFALARRVAAAPSTSVLILGESGTGKEVLASWIHRHSPRAAGPFVRVNLAALPNSMVEAELFGAVKGSYTGSQRDRSGLLRSAEGGTLLLDELCEFDIDMQAKLLRVLEQRTLRPIGSDAEIPFDVRVLAATNRDPVMAISEGRLREDLYYRLATVSLKLPPLRERQLDILPLARSFLNVYSPHMSRRVLLGHDAELALLNHRWPGNIRELRNVIERAAIVSRGPMIGAEDLGLRADEQAGAAADLDTGTGPLLKLEQVRREAVEEIERQHIRRAFELSDGSMSRTAELLGISRSTLWAKVRKYKLGAIKEPG